MKVIQLLESRQENWQELERLCEVLQNSRRGALDAEQLVRFSSLYRAACADLALADAYQLPENTVQYLHRLVARAHNQLYRSRKFDLAHWTELLLLTAPRRIFNDRCVQFASLVFWAVFLLSAILSFSKDRWPGYAESMLSRGGIEQLEESFDKPIGGRDPASGLMAAAFYIRHNTGIGLKCFVGGLLVLPGLFVTVFNAGYLGAAFGYMARPDVPSGDNFFQFVTAHGPFELTAIVLSAGAGLKLGLSWIVTRGYSRGTSLRLTAAEAMPLMGAAMVLFCLAAFVEGLVSPSSAPYWLKAAMAVISSGLVLFYFVILGFPKEADARETGPR